MYCPKCRSEYRTGIARCAVCDVALVAELPAQDEFVSAAAMAKALADKELHPLLMGNFATLEEAQKMFMAERVLCTIARGNEDENDAGGMHSRLYLLVAAEDVERAGVVLHSRWKNRAESEGLLVTDVSSLAADKCPACGSEVATNVVECPECGLFLGEA